MSGGLPAARAEQPTTLPVERKKLICNHSSSCGVSTCPHSSVHYSHPDGTAKKPQCEDEGTYCYTIKEYVNCEEVR